MGVEHKINTQRKAWKNSLSDMDEKIQRLIESNDKIIAITQSERPKVTAPKIVKDVFSEAPLASQIYNGTFQFRETIEITRTRQDKIIKNLFAGQIIRGIVANVRPSIGVLVRVAQILDFDSHEAISDLNNPEALFSSGIFFLCSPLELGESLTEQLAAEVLPRFTVGDQVKAIGLDKTPFELDCSIGAMYENPSSENGLLNRNIVEDASFGNLYALPQMLSAYSLEESGSLLPSRPVGLYSEGDSWEKLRDMQNRQWANEMVTRAITDYARKNDFENAIKCYNQVLGVTPSHVDALVARGAAYANQKKFAEAAADFTKALEVDPKHENAKKYLTTVNGKLEEEKKKRKIDDRATLTPVPVSVLSSTTASSMSSTAHTTTSSSTSQLKSSGGGDEKRHKKEKKKSKKEKKHKHKYKKEKKKRSSSTSSSSSSSSSSD